MNAEALVTLVIAVCGGIISWAAWVSVSIFKHTQEISLLKMELKTMQEISVVLKQIHEQLKKK